MEVFEIEQAGLTYRAQLEPETAERIGAKPVKKTPAKVKEGENAAPKNAGKRA